MVGTSATVAFLARRLSSARRSEGSVRTTIGGRDIGVQSVVSKARLLLTLRRGLQFYQSRTLTATVPIDISAVGHFARPAIQALCVRQLADAAARCVRFMIEHRQSSDLNAVALI
jgi:hypothetical protein